jgi:hypothetical protein
LFYFFGVLIYIVLWILMPPPIDTPGQEKTPKPSQTVPPEPPVSPDSTDTTGSADDSADADSIHTDDDGKPDEGNGGDDTGITTNGTSAENQSRPDDPPAREKGSEMRDAGRNAGIAISGALLAVIGYTVFVGSVFGITAPWAIVMMSTLVAGLSIAAAAVFMRTKNIEAAAAGS